MESQPTTDPVVDWDELAESSDNDDGGASSAPAPPQHASGHAESSSAVARRPTPREAGPLWSDPSTMAGARRPSSIVGRPQEPSPPSRRPGGGEGRSLPLPPREPPRDPPRLATSPAELPPPSPLLPHHRPTCLSPMAKTFALLAPRGVSSNSRHSRCLSSNSRCSCSHLSGHSRSCSRNRDDNRSNHSNGRRHISSRDHISSRR